ncbi:hypothetical protein Nepgr_013539 [Nepenthes gracilis]|uniref:Uncharacterized protein n=1 Tax=Nepenthes gracilis TaxID=150966 RepID=A0AAD3XP38_NEPGR|nr:hypothetical protein Nepgr_013539 [Nepenthes gracilis]
MVSRGPLRFHLRMSPIFCDSVPDEALPAQDSTGVYADAKTASIRLFSVLSLAARNFECAVRCNARSAMLPQMIGQLC